MDVDAVPQDGNVTLGGHRKAVYARDARGRMVITTSRGWEAEEIVTSHAVEVMKQQAHAALERARAGAASPLEYWMYARRMDVALLAQTTGFWQWRVRRHMRPDRFAQLHEKHLQRYAQALGLSVQDLRSVP
ncbi:hypothetical protein M8A51_06460 [Schlegelella sp. S2-27]|uniref:Uncharacterized protein n=1 Tax=Caldimonas mangrovi TaxID=2944811 RepID=A0ABT0YLZ5_9BURK|nr:hypothetical protein [Caldimonas mangrovi]MCM5679171.1 hypothetical protein [Caldimonas mangrovi]